MKAAWARCIARAMRSSGATSPSKSCQTPSRVTPNVLRRFRREAQALAALNDSHIAQIYHLEEPPTAGAALVMEFVDGKTIADMVHGRPLDTGRGLRYAAEIAAGLETAHEKGIVHRDLKPANVKVTTGGDGSRSSTSVWQRRWVPGPETRRVQLANSPTLTARATEAGMILGTAAYMSPEQARGKALDKRTDIWAFGCVLFEMLTGRRDVRGRDRLRHARVGAAIGSGLVGASRRRPAACARVAGPMPRARRDAPLA